MEQTKMKKQDLFDVLYKILDLRVNRQKLFKDESITLGFDKGRSTAEKRISFVLMPQIALTLDVFKTLDELCKEYNLEYRHESLEFYFHAEISLF